MVYEKCVRMHELNGELESVRFQLRHAEERIKDLKQRFYTAQNMRQRNQFISRLNGEICGLNERITLLEAELDDLKER